MHTYIVYIVFLIKLKQNTLQRYQIIIRTNTMYLYHDIMTNMNLNFSIFLGH